MLNKQTTERKAAPKPAEKTFSFSRGRSTTPGLTEPAGDFLKSLEAKKQSYETVKKRDDDLRKLLLYLDTQQIGSFADVEQQTLEDYRLALVDHGYSDSTIESAQRAALHLFRYLEETGVLFENPARNIKIKKAPVIMGTILTEQEMLKLLAQPDLTHRRGLRDRALLEVIYTTGMRRAEAAALTIFDLQLEHEIISVTGKGRKQRLLPLGRHAIKYLQLYLKNSRPEYLPKLSPAPDALWLNRHREPLSSQGITGIIKRHGKACGVRKKIDAHTLRRTCATQMLRSGAHPAAVARMLGHSGLKSLSHYLQTTITDLIKSHAMSKPGR